MTPRSAPISWRPVPKLEDPFMNVVLLIPAAYHHGIERRLLAALQ